MLKWLDKANGSHISSVVLIYRRMSGRRAVVVVYISPTLVATKVLIFLVSIMVFLVVHSNLRHHRIVHSLGECTDPEVLCNGDGKSRLRPVQSLDIEACSWLRKSFKNGSLHA